VETHSPVVEETRRTVLGLLASNYPAEAVERWPDKTFHHWLKWYGVEIPSPESERSNPKSEIRNPEEIRSSKVQVTAAPSAAAGPAPGTWAAPGVFFTPESPVADFTHPYLAVDMARCITCFRCQRICDDVQGQFVWHALGRGADTRLAPDGPTLLT